MVEDEIFKEIKKFLKKFTNKNITLDSKIKDLGLDSLDLIDCVMKAEDVFNIRIPDDELLTIVTVKNLVDIINKLKK